MIDCSNATPDEKEQFLGREFREIHVVGIDCGPAGMVTTILLESQKVTLIGDPQKALLVYLGGADEAPAVVLPAEGS